MMRARLAAILFAVVCCTPGVAALAQDFGAPPSGTVPILFNDRHVYARPDVLQHGRTLVAIVRKNVVMVPMRSAFEQTGATVSYDPSTRTVDVSKPGADVKVTVGKAWVDVNGEERPLDVPPVVVRGVLLVPLRVIFEGMGAYVQWVPQQHLVAIRYVEAVPEAPPAGTPPPTTTPVTPAASPAPVATPSATPRPPSAYERYVAGDYQLSPKVYNELSPGNGGSHSYEIKGAIEFPLLGPTWEVSANYRHVQYPHFSDLSATGCVPGTAGCNTVLGADPIYQRGACPSADPGCVTTVGKSLTEAQSGLGQAYVTAFTAAEEDADVHFGLKVANPRIYVGVGEYFKSYDYLGYPKLSGFGFGAEKLPDLDAPFAVYGSAFYYPSVSGTYTFARSTYLGSLSGQSIPLSYGAWKYELGATVGLGKNFYLDLGYLGEKLNPRSNAPTGTSENSPYAGLGLHI